MIPIGDLVVTTRHGGSPYRGPPQLSVVVPLGDRIKTIRLGGSLNGFPHMSVVIRYVIVYKDTTRLGGALDGCPPTSVGRDPLKVRLKRHDSVVPMMGSTTISAVICFFFIQHDVVVLHESSPTLIVLNDMAWRFSS